MKQKVFVGMSGGVDSSLTAGLLVEQGYDVTGVYMKNWTHDLPGMRCPWADDMADAKRVAVQLGIPFKVYDFQTEYRQKVVDYMVEEYQAGRTPNPDVMCNQFVKFKLFLDAALADGADFIATGHYAKTEDKTSFGQQVQKAHLFRPEDEVKDQTYFLYRISQRALLKTMFPLGIYKKTQVRELAEKRNLVTASRPDSQGICFVGSVGIQEFLSEFVDTSPGNIVDNGSGKTLGQHSGAIFYTLGQRHGLDLGGGIPYYVVGKDMAKNEVYVSRDLNDSSMWRQQIELSDLCWINDAPGKTEQVQVRLRHRGKLLPATFDGRILHMVEAERAVATGQSAVIYRGEEVLGGGFVFR